MRIFSTDMSLSKNRYLLVFECTFFQPASIPQFLGFLSISLNNILNYFFIYRGTINYSRYRILNFLS